jgi:hypothetical protein
VALDSRDDWPHVGAAPTFWLVPESTLPDAETVLALVRAGGHPKVVAMVGYHDDPEAGTIARRLPYGNRGEGIEEIVFCRTGPATGETLQFEDAAWPGEDRTYVLDEVEAATELARRFAVEYGAEGSVVLVTGGSEFVAAVATVVG